MDFSDQFLKML